MPCCSRCAPVGSGGLPEVTSRPILKEHCWDCHSNEKEAKGGLAFDDLEDLTKSQIHPVGLIRPGDPEKSDFLDEV
jgi:hypothetical protein